MFYLTMSWKSPRTLIAKAVEYANLHDLILVELSDRPLKLGRVTDPKRQQFRSMTLKWRKWLGYIRDAAPLFTNSFHACCFSMLLENLFLVSGGHHPEKGSQLSSTFGLTEPVKL